MSFCVEYKITRLSLYEVNVMWEKQDVNVMIYQLNNIARYQKELDFMWNKSTVG